MTRLFWSLICLFVTLSPLSAETVTFETQDGLTVTADLNKPQGKADVVIILFHMAGASRGEYRDITPRLNSLGYTTLAVDQRSGGTFNNVENETATRFGHDPGYQAATPDLEAASKWVREKLNAKRVGVIGSSYSASLVLVLAGRDPAFADAVAAFSPGEYFSDRSLVTKALPHIKVPVFLTSARQEVTQWQDFSKHIKSPVTGFVPKGAGRHGASSLVSAARKEYWVALETFLTQKLPVR